MEKLIDEMDCLFKQVAKYYPMKDEKNVRLEWNDLVREVKNCIKPDVSGMVCEKNLQTHNCFAHENMIKGCLECPHFIKQTYH